MKLIGRPEQELLLCCARKQVDAETSARIQDLLNNELDWPYLWQIAHHHAVAPLLYWNLRAACSERVSPKLMQRLQDSFCLNNEKNMILVRELIRLVKLFNDKNIPLIPYKGIMLTLSVYENLALRQMTDLDILVREEDLPRAMDLLHSQGYGVTFQLPWEYHFTKPNSLHNIDLHCPMFSETTFVFSNPEMVWENLDSLSFAGATLPNLNPEMTLLILCINANKDAWNRLKQISDIATLIQANPDLDWENFIKQQKDLGSIRIVFLGIFLAKILLNAPISDRIWPQIQSDSVVSALASQAIDQLFFEIPIMGLNEFIFQMRMRERFQDRVKLFWKWTQPQKIDNELFPLPNSLSFFYYLIRPLRLLWKHGLHNTLKVIHRGLLLNASHQLNA